MPGDQNNQLLDASFGDLLYRTERNDIFEIVRRIGGDPLLIRVRCHRVAEKELRLKVDGEPTFYFFMAAHSTVDGRSPEGFWRISGVPQYTPSPTTDWIKWSVLYTHLEKWVSRVKKELDAPDLWAAFVLDQRTTAFAGARPSDESFRPFTADEKVVIRRALSATEQKIDETFHPSRDEMAYVRERLDYIADRLDHLNRFDWKGVFLESIMSVGVGLALDAVGVRTLFEVVKQTFGQILRLLPSS